MPVKEMKRRSKRATELGLNKQDANDRKKWRKGIMATRRGAV